MNSFFKIRTRRQIYLLLPWLAGTLSGLLALLFLFTIPSDARNSVIFGFSIFRLLEGAGILFGTVVFAVISIRLAHEPDFSLKIIGILGWNRNSPPSLFIAWGGILVTLFVILFGR